MASRPWAGGRLSLGSIQVGRFGVPYLALAAIVRLVLTCYALINRSDLLNDGDLPFYWHFAQLSDHGQYPFLHFWMEYPPVFPFLISGYYRLLALFNLTSAEQFSAAFALLVYAVEVVNLALVYHLVRRARGERAARWATAIYAGCPALIWISTGWFDPLAVLFCLAALNALSSKRAATAGVFIALGVLTKIYPGVLLLALPAALGWRASTRAVAGFGATLVVILGPLLLVRPDLLLASLVSMTSRPPWETVAAVLSGYYGWGRQPLLEDRFNAATAYGSAGTPVWVTLLPVALVLLAAAAAWVALKRQRTAPADTCRVAALAVIAFVLGNKGFSPQFVVWLIPMVLVAWPNRIGVLYIGLLTIHTWGYVQIVFPTMYAYYADHEVALDVVRQAVTVSVLLRTALIVWVAGHLFTQLVGAPERQRLAVTSWPRLAFLGITHTNRGFTRVVDQV